jgi:hypothetical protein
MCSRTQYTPIAGEASPAGVWRMRNAQAGVRRVLA